MEMLRVEGQQLQDRCDRLQQTNEQMIRDSDAARESEAVSR